jgi:hypothetical protein
MITLTITDKLPQFINQEALFVVAGKQSATIYTAKDKKMNKIKVIEIPKEKYSDKEGFFKMKGGASFVSGYVKEEDKQHTINKFLKKLSEALKEMFTEKTYSNIYLFSPKQINIENVIPISSKQFIKGQYKGNYLKKHPFFLLKKIKK